MKNRGKVKRKRYVWGAPLDRRVAIRKRIAEINVVLEFDAKEHDLPEEELTALTNEMENLQDEYASLS